MRDAGFEGPFGSFLAVFVPPRVVTDSSPQFIFGLRLLAAVRVPGGRRAVRFQFPLELILGKPCFPPIIAILDDQLWEQETFFRLLLLVLIVFDSRNQTAACDVSFARYECPCGGPMLQFTCGES